MRRMSAGAHCLLGMLLLLSLATRVRAQPHAFEDETPRRRLLVDGGVSFIDAPLTSYGMGGGLGLGIELPRSRAFSFLGRLEFDRCTQDEHLPDVPRGTASVLTARVGMRFTRSEGAGLGQYTEATVGGAYQWLSAYEPGLVPAVPTRSEDNGASGVFAFGLGMSYHGAEPPGFFLEWQIAQFFGGNPSQTTVMPIRLGFTAP